MKKLTVALSILIIVFSRCSITSKGNEVNESKTCLLLKIQKFYVGQTQPEIFYCLTEKPEKELISVMNGNYKSEYDFYDTLHYRLNAKCVLDKWGKDWDSSCSAGRLKSIKSSAYDSQNSKGIVELISNDSNFSFRPISIVKLLGSGLTVGVSRLNEANYCNVFSGLTICMLNSDSIIILKKGFKMNPYKIDNP